MSADPTPAVTGEVARKIDSVLDGYVHVYQTNQDHKFQGSSVYWDIHNNIRKSLKDSLAASEAEAVKVEAVSEDTKRLDWLQRDMLFSEPTGIEWSDGKFTFPYLVNSAGGSGAGVGHARFKTLREAIDAAIAASPSSTKEQP